MRRRNVRVDPVIYLAINHYDGGFEIGLVEAEDGPGALAKAKTARNVRGKLTIAPVGHMVDIEFPVTEADLEPVLVSAPDIFESDPE